jgi:hypothetical protein
MIAGVEAAMVALVAVMVGLLVVGVMQSARRAGRDAVGARRLGLAVAGGLALWLAVTAGLAATGVLSQWGALPPRWPLLPLSTLVAMLLLGRTSTAKELTASAPAPWPVAIQGFRIAVELLLFAFYQAGRAPLQVTFEGRNLDILVGLTAPLVAWLVARQRLSPRLVALWNVLGLAVLANTVGTVATSVPGPLHLDWPGEPFVALVTWPLIWLPACLAPLAVFFHLVSLRQSLGLVPADRARLAA